METNINYTLVGAFVIILLSAIAGSIIWLSSGFSVDRYKNYIVYMKESVNGLNVDAPVEFNGVTVGTVQDIQINQKDPQIVELILSVKENTPITRGTVAMLNMKGVTGIAYMSLRDKGLDRDRLERKKGERYPVINTAPSLFLRFDTTLTELNESLRRVSESVQALLNKQNLDSVKHILQDMQMTMRAFPSLAATTQSTFNIFTTQTLPAMNQAMVNLDSITSNLVGISAELKQNPAILIRGKTLPPLGPGEQ